MFQLAGGSKCLAVHLGQQPLFLARLQAQLRDSTPTGLFFRASPPSQRHEFLLV